MRYFHWPINNFDRQVNSSMSCCISALDELTDHLESPEHAVEMKYLLLEQKYLELLLKRNTMQAVQVRRKLTKMFECQFLIFISCLPGSPD